MKWSLPPPVAVPSPVTMLSPTNQSSPFIPMITSWAPPEALKLE